MPWWGWIVVGAVLLAAELFVVPTDFFLVFLGSSAIAVGLVGMIGVALPDWGQWALFGVLSLLTLVFFRGWFKSRFHSQPPARVDDTLAGEFGTLAQGTGMGRNAQDPGQIDKLFILDVNGCLAIIDVSYYAGTPQSVVDDLDRIVESAGIASSKNCASSAN